MTGGPAPLDLAVVGLYAVGIFALAHWVGRGRAKDSTDYFLAAKALPWWAIARR